MFDIARYRGNFLANFLFLFHLPLVYTYVATHPRTELLSITLSVLLHFLATRQLPFSIVKYIASFALNSEVYLLYIPLSLPNLSLLAALEPFMMCMTSVFAAAIIDGSSFLLNGPLGSGKLILEHFLEKQIYMLMPNSANVRITTHN